MFEVGQTVKVIALPGHGRTERKALLNKTGVVTAIHSAFDYVDVHMDEPTGIAAGEDLLFLPTEIEVYNA